MSRVKKLSDVGKAIEEAYLADETITLRRLANAYNCSPGTVRSCLIERGIKLRSRGRRKTKVDVLEPKTPQAPQDPAPEDSLYEFQLKD